MCRDIRQMHTVTSGIVALLLDLYVKSAENHIYRNARYACSNICVLKDALACFPELTYKYLKRFHCVPKFMGNLAFNGDCLQRFNLLI